MSTYMIWFDDSKRTTEQKIAAGVVRYVERYDTHPNTVITNPTEVVEVAGVQVRGELRIRPNNFHIGIEGDGAGKASELTGAGR